MLHQSGRMKKISVEYLPAIQAIKLSNGQVVTEEEFRRWGAENEKDWTKESLIEFLSIQQKRKKKLKI